ncbi:DNA-3-methyladenine glycosylase [Candidatus Saccharibacteria bacterium]|nr:DNA-3-methyladenine glycosylase [Candidatus Saccharibacteria bacterium]
MKPKIAQIVSQPSIKAAPLLLGCYLNRTTPDGLIKLKIVETEAYHQEDPASHSFRGHTPRTAPMFEAGGRIYVYFTYGMHYCLNIVVGQKGVGEAVLIRAAEPVEGLEAIKANRGITVVKNLTNGPGKLAQALGIRDTKLSGQILNRSSIWLEPSERAVEPSDIVAAPRVGIKQAIDLPWRFYIRGNPFVSKL